jgi:hypothetical protein
MEQKRTDHQSMAGAANHGAEGWGSEEWSSEAWGSNVYRSEAWGSRAAMAGTAKDGA